MNKTLALSAFVMFAVIMGMSAIAPAAFADHDNGKEGKSQDANAADKSANCDPAGDNPNANKGKSGSAPSRAACDPPTGGG